jgi:hypothetical protein
MRHDRPKEATSNWAEFRSGCERSHKRWLVCSDGANSKVTFPGRIAAALVLLMSGTLFAQVSSASANGDEGVTPGSEIAVALQAAPSSGGDPLLLTPTEATVATGARIRQSDSLGTRRFLLGIRGGFLLPQNDLRLTTGHFPQIAAGVDAELVLHGMHCLGPVAEWWYFTPGHQVSADASQSQAIDTRLRALVFGGEYRYRLGGPLRRLSVGGGLYLVRWSVDSVNTLTLPAGTAQASGNSHWVRFGMGGAVNYRVFRRIELEGRWIYSTYGYEHIPVNVAILCVGWHF